MISSVPESRAFTARHIHRIVKKKISLSPLSCLVDARIITSITICLYDATAEEKKKAPLSSVHRKDARKDTEISHVI
ncbi:hypothetical protein E2C01_097382 [Portunus trituberculatus]|uniref:Uncharacterized protein n=1 Tax=Portunus trituberculatus TaxID=210409 RepID=A0A5B7K5J5_PORTR|nr:hypothetical protein [Portunus trituberculatus]